MGEREDFHFQTLSCLCLEKGARISLGVPGSEFSEMVRANCYVTVYSGPPVINIVQIVKKRG